MPSPRLPLGAVLLGLLVGACGPQDDRPGDGAGPGAEPGPADESRAAVSARLRERLDADDLDAAHAALLVLRRDHEGRGELPDGRVLAPEALTGAVFDQAIALARRDVSGPRADVERAARRLRVAESLAPDLDETEAPLALAAARRWVALDTLARLATPLAPHPGPRVVVAADDFDLGEPSLARPLARWAKEGAAAGLRVGVLPLLRGYVRVGTRRTRAQDVDEERRAVAARLADTLVVLEPEPADATAAAADLGLLGRDVAVLVADREGRIVARLAGRGLDLDALEGAVQRVGSR
jgi:hypothetical protein